ncbi:MAG TPA: alkaline phosphatase family protein [Conexibacter sp.]
MRRLQGAIAAALLVGAVGTGTALTLNTGSAHGSGEQAELVGTKTPIKHLVVLFSENVSFDHYFGTYPNAANTDGVPFTAAPDTPRVNGITPELMTNNPNSANPVRLTPDEAITCDQGHGYPFEQRAYDNGRVDRFVENTSGHCNTADGHDMVMGYYDGNTVTALWNYAQHFSLNDNSYGTTYGPSAVGAINLISGQTGGATPTDMTSATSHGTIYGDPDPKYDECGAGTIEMHGKNVGDLLNDRDLTWGFFEGGFRSTSNVLSSTSTVAACAQRDTNIGGTSQVSYIPHHQPFEYYLSTSNPRHLPPSSQDAIGATDRANHQYDLEDFNATVANGDMPSVSYVKAPGFQDGHPGYSDPIDEQHFFVDEINRIEASPQWDSTAVVIAYDDSDGWYDHVMPPTVRGSRTNEDYLGGTGICGPEPAADATPVRCGFGPRLPLMVISPWAKQNYVDTTETDQSSILKFVEDNWSLGRIGGDSADATAGSIENMFDFNPSDPRAPKVVLGLDGTVKSIGDRTVAPETRTVTQTVTTPGQPVTTPGQTVTVQSRPATTTPTSKPGSVKAGVKTSGRGLAVTLRAPAGARASGTVKLTARVASGHRTRTVTVGSRAFSLAAGASQTLQVALNSAGRRALQSAGKLKVTVAITAKAVGGSTTRSHGTVTLKAASSKRSASKRTTRSSHAAR